MVFVARQLQWSIRGVYHMESLADPERTPSAPPPGTNSYVFKYVSAKKHRRRSSPPPPPPPTGNPGSATGNHLVPCLLGYQNNDDVRILRHAYSCYACFTDSYYTLYNHFMVKVTLFSQHKRVQEAKDITKGIFTKSKWKIYSPEPEDLTLMSGLRCYF